MFSNFWEFSGLAAAFAIEEELRRELEAELRRLEAEAAEKAEQELFVEHQSYA